MSPLTTMSAVVSLLALLSAATTAEAFSLRRLLQDKDAPVSRKELRAEVMGDTQGSAWTSAEGNNPGGVGDAFTWEHAESSSTSQTNGVFWAAGRKAVESGDMAKGTWAGAYTKDSPDGPNVGVVASTMDAEYSFQRGTNAIANTMQGARAVAGSGGMFSMSSEPVIAATWTMDSYGPTAYKNNMVEGVDGLSWQRSVAYTDIAPTSVAQAGIGSGPAAVSSGFEFSAAARSHRDKALPVTAGHRETGDKGFDSPFDALKSGRRRLALAQRRKLLLRGRQGGVARRLAAL